MSKDVFMNGSQVDLMMMLEAREQRSLTQKQLFESQPKASLLSATMNIPGPIKTSPMLRDVFEAVLDAVHNHPTLRSVQSISKLYREEATGPEYYLLLDLPAKELKAAMIEVEESHPWGRLLDLDVLYCEVEQNQNQPDSMTLQIHGTSRSDLNLPSRRCLICQEDAKVCGRSRKHSIEDMQAAITQLIENERENVND